MPAGEWDSFGNDGNAYISNADSGESMFEYSPNIFNLHASPNMLMSLDKSNDQNSFNDTYEDEDEDKYEDDLYGL